MRRIRLPVCGIICFLSVALGSSATTFYVSPGGNDSWAGTSPTGPWKTLSKVNAATFSAGDVVAFARGGTWTGCLTIHNSGHQGQPITVTAYGTNPARPVIRNPGSWTYSVVLNGDWIVVEELLLKDSHFGGVRIPAGAEHNVVRNCEVKNTGTAVKFEGSYNLAASNRIHDLVMVVNTQGGYDDFGAVGFIVEAPCNEIAYNEVWNCVAPSYDFGRDGGVVELYGDVDYTSVHHNRTWGCDGFVEVGGSPGHAHGCRIFCNLSLNNRGRFATLHNTDSFSSDIHDLRMDHNTIVENEGDQEWVVLWFSGSPSSASVLFRNNITYAQRVRYLANLDFNHSYNLYRLLNGGTQLIATGAGLRTGEAFGDPQFVSVTQEDFHLQEGGPAVDAGFNLGYNEDLDGVPIPQGKAPDLGAFERPNSSPPAPPANLRVLSQGEI